MEYYENLVEHTGEAARYQLFAEVFADSEIDGLSITLPAVEARMGNKSVYTFAITPDHLLKISYVAHRNRGELGAAGNDAYQRMVKKKRLDSIRKFIDNGGFFPTNIVINFNAPKKGGSTGLRFEPTTQKESVTPNVRLGWLHLPARYQSAWIIDGQHRLLAYSGYERASKSFLSVTAYDDLEVSKQLELFTTINSEQKKVSGNLLTELYADFKWNSPNKEDQILSVVSRAVLRLAGRSSSPLHHRILTADDTMTDTRCISLLSITSALQKHKFFLISKSNGEWFEFGPLWRGSPQPTLERTMTVLDGWFCAISETAGDIWQLGKNPGGYLATSNGVVVCIGILRRVFEHLDAKGSKCIQLKDTELVEHIQPFGQIVGEYFATLRNDELQQIRRKFGAAGQDDVRNLVLVEIRKQIPDFNPPGLAEWMEKRADDKRDDAIALLESVVNRLRQYIVNTLQANFGDDREDWWQEVPQTVRVSIARLREKDNRSQGDEENYLSYKDFRSIVKDHWKDLFQSTLAYGNSGNKDQRTEWLDKLGSIQTKLSKDASTGLQIDEYNTIVEIDGWLADKNI